MILEPWQWALGFACAFLNGVAKTGVPGLGILVVPLMLYVVTDPRISPGVVLPLLQPFVPCAVRVKISCRSAPERASAIVCSSP